MRKHIYRSCDFKLSSARQNLQLLPLPREEHSSKHFSALMHHFTEEAAACPEGQAGLQNEGSTDSGKPLACGAHETEYHKGLGKKKRQ